MNIKEQAEIFAIKAHDGKFRKADSTKPYVIHPIDVANKLHSFGFSDEVSAAGHLHDVVEDTKVSLLEIQNLFGEYVASLVRGATETSKLDKNNINQLEKSWYERKSETIERVKGLDFEHKALVAVDKISNLEDMLILFGKQGKINFENFRAGYDCQRWYYNGVYESLIADCDETQPVFQELRRLIDLVFEPPYSLFSQNKDSILFYKIKELLKLKGLFQSTSSSSLTLYFSTNCNKEIYSLIKEKLIRFNIYTNLLEKGQMIDNYPQISYQINNHILRVQNKFYYQTERNDHYLAWNPSLEYLSDLIIDIIMGDLYNQELNTVKRKIREKKELSLN